MGALVGLEALVGWIFGLAEAFRFGWEFWFGGSFWLVWVSLDGNFG